MKIYLIPGQAYTSEIFKNIDINGYDYKYIEWIEPKKKESFKNYSERMSKKIIYNENLVLIGHSLGGLVALEIASFMKTSKVILISSMKSRKEMPFLLRLVKPLGIYIFISRLLGVNTIKYWGKRHDFVTKEDQSLFKRMILKHSNKYLRWSFKNLSAWKAPEINPETKIIHIHGTKDRTFPFKKIIKPVIAVENGSHIMVYKKGEEVTRVLLREL